MKAAVVYWSGTGNTAAMADLVLEGMQSMGVQADLLECNSVTDLSGYDAIAFGCPAMGSEQLEDSEFEPMFDSVKKNLSGKKIALFGSYGWGDGEWMRNWEDDCMRERPGQRRPGRCRR